MAKSRADFMRGLAAVGGVIAGLPLSLTLYWVGTQLTFGHQTVSGVGPQGSAWFNLTVLVAVAAAIIVLFRRSAVASIHPTLRAFLLGALFVMLGGMSLCNAFSMPQLVPKG